MTAKLQEAEQRRVMLPKTYDSDCPLILYLQGAPGSGKTMTVWNNMLSWAKAHEHERLLWIHIHRSTAHGDIAIVKGGKIFRFSTAVSTKWKKIAAQPGFTWAIIDGYRRHDIDVMISTCSQCVPQ